MKTELEALRGLASDLLHDEARRRGRDLLRSHWAMAACLLAVERAEVHLAHGCSGVVQYAVRFLEMDGHLAAELVRAARVLEAMPDLSAAFEAGEVAWSKTREITRVAKAEDDAAWTAFARTHSIDEIRQRTVLTPRRWNEQQALAARAAAPVQMTLTAPAEPEAHVSAAEGPTLERLAPSELETGTGAFAVISDIQESSDATFRSSSPESAHCVPSQDDGQPSGGMEQPHLAGVEEVAHAFQDRPAMPAVEARIRLELRLTPEEFQIYQQLERSVRARERRPMTKEAVFVELCRRAQGGGDRRPRIRTTLVVHYDRPHERGWIETSRGIAPVSEARMEKALAEAENVMVVTAPHVPAAGEADEPVRRAEQPSPEASTRAPRSSRGKKDHRRPAIPVAILDALFARSGGCCEMPGCRRSGYLHVHHRLPWSRGGRHDLDNLLLCCSTCHRMHHRAEQPLLTPQGAKRRQGKAPTAAVDVRPAAELSRSVGDSS